MGSVGDLRPWMLVLLSLLGKLALHWEVARGGGCGIKQSYMSFMVPHGGLQGCA